MYLYINMYVLYIAFIFCIQLFNVTLKKKKVYI